MINFEPWFLLAAESVILRIGPFRAADLQQNVNLFLSEP
jgi:hypothetical protein